MVKRERHVVNSISFLVGFIKDLGFRRIILKCGNEPSTEALRGAVIHACVGVEVIPQGTLRVITWPRVVEMAVRETTMQNSQNFR